MSWVELGLAVNYQVSQSVSQSLSQSVGGVHLVVQQTSNQSSLPSCLTVHLTTIPPIGQLLIHGGDGGIDRLIGSVLDENKL